jgi:cellulose synthase/poly-beta-1,6-N-acetylglucosamine synthase-like glycosyltransferase
MKASTNPRSQRHEVSAIVVCFNEEDRIEACLESLRWCDEVVVVDSFSTDRTPEICRRYTDRLFSARGRDIVTKRPMPIPKRAKSGCCWLTRMNG